MGIEKLLTDLTLEEKAALLSGTDLMHTNKVPRLKIPALHMADGPHGIRKSVGGAINGTLLSEPATAFPTAATTACSWNPDNLKKIGVAMANECRALGININLGPAVNLKRDPRCGRNFEYFSEDPHLTGVLGAALAGAIQSMGVGVSVKHFAANNQENYRMMGNSVIDERALRELYLKGFERIVKDVKPFTVMCAYNKINGEYCSENSWLLTKVLRNEWKFDGAVITDWGAANDRAKGVKAGLDIEMPGDTAEGRRAILEAIKDGTLSMDDIDKAVRNVLNLIKKCSVLKKQETFNKNEHNAIAGDVAADSAVLLKNNGALPLKKEERLVIIGELFEKMRYQGAGSSMINPTKITTPKNAFDKAGIEYSYYKGYRENMFKPDKMLIKKALSAAYSADKVVVFAGLTDSAENEGADRNNLNLPYNQVELIEALFAAGKKIILVLFGGAPIEMPFKDGVDAILNMILPGQNGGDACLKLLFGQINPSGKLAETWVKKLEDIPFFCHYSKNVHELYRESIFVGYRYFDTVKKEVLFPFGYGLSYTQFDYSNLIVEEAGDEITVICSLKNTGNMYGAEILQLYVKNNKSKVFKAEKELRAFTKVYLAPGETKTAKMRFNKFDLSYFNTAEKKWILENGSYEVLAGSSSADIRLKKELEIINQKEATQPYSNQVLLAYINAANITDEAFSQLIERELPINPPAKPLHIDSRIIDYKKTFLGWIIRRAMLGVIKKQLRAAKKKPKGIERDNCIKAAKFLALTMDSNCMRGVSMCAAEKLPYNTAEGLVAISNGHIIKGLRKIKSKIIVPPLPKDEYK